MLKKRGLLSTYSCLQCCSSVHPTAAKTPPSSLFPPRARPIKSPRTSSQWRSYADVRHPREPDFRDNMNWPAQKTPSAIPTPYEIFAIERGAVYSKHKFYELVKTYHPDRHGHDDTFCGGISHVEKLERYRLVILAHEILSDPIKRRAYDSYGAGWGEHGRESTRHTRGYYSPTSDRPYGTGPGCDNSPFANATWEDWERWYRRSEHTPKQAYAGNYFNPNAFASFVILLAVITGVAQATRAGQYSGSLEEKAQVFTEETSRFLSSRADHYVENRLSSDGRVKHFLQKRDPSTCGLKDEEEEAYRTHFAPDAPTPPKAPSKKQDWEKPD
jgi:curved DNA-binding protein CbpA